MKNLKLTIKAGVKLEEKINLFKELFDFDFKTETIEVRITGLLSNSTYGTDKVKYELIDIKNNIIICNNMNWNVIGDIELELFIYTK